MSIMTDVQAMQGAATRFQATQAELMGNREWSQEGRTRRIEEARNGAETTVTATATALWGAAEYYQIGEGVYYGVYSEQGAIWQALGTKLALLHLATRDAQRKGINSGWLAHETNRAKALIEESQQAGNSYLKRSSMDLITDAYNTGNPEFRFAMQDLFPSTFRSLTGAAGVELEAGQFRQRLIEDRRARVDGDPAVMEARSALFQLALEVVQAYRATQSAINAVVGAASDGNGYLSVFKSAVSFALRDIQDSDLSTGGMMVSFARHKFGRGASVTLDSNGNIASFGGNVDRTVQSCDVLITDQSVVNAIMPYYITAGDIRARMNG